MTMLQELKDLFDSGKWASLEETLRRKVEEEQAKEHATPSQTPTSDAVGALDVVAEAGYPFVAGRTYRIHFKNGNSGEYDGSALLNNFPFPADQVQSVDMIPLAGAD
jgi:hypothetical protein